MKILYVSIFEMPHIGGLSHRFLSEISWLKKKGNQVQVLSCPPEKPELEKMLRKGEIDAFHYEQGSSTAGGKLRKLDFYVRKIRELYSRGHYDVIHAHDVYSAFYCVLAGVGRKTVLTTHSVYSTDYFVMGNKQISFLRRHLLVPAKFVLDNLVEEIAYRGVAKVICVSEWEEARARKTLGKSPKVVIIRNGVDTTEYNRSEALRKRFRKKLGIVENDFLFSFVGRFVHKNGPVLITRAAELVSKKARNAKFVLIGEGSELEECRRLAKELDIDDVVFFPGYKKDVVDALSASDAFVSHVTDSMKGIGINVLEAMACGLVPVVGRDEITEKILSDGFDSVQVTEGSKEDLAGKMISLTRNKKRAGVLGKNALESIRKKFSLRVTLQKVEETLKNIAVQ
jgi:glycosyltransferase involved in cell wall biosynthesis